MGHMVNQLKVRNAITEIDFSVITENNHNDRCS